MTEFNLDSLNLPGAAEISAAFRQARDRALDEVGPRLKALTQTSVQQSGMTIRTGAVLNWQKLYRGRGYVAVRPEASSLGANSPGAITNYLEGGHRIRKPSGRAQRYTPRIHKGYVKGFGFYADARDGAEALAQEVAARVSQIAAEEIR